MGELVHRTRATIYRDDVFVRRAVIKGYDEPVYYGPHGGVERYYGVRPLKEHPSTLDHIIAATAA